MTVLRIDSSARLEGANSRIISDYLVRRLGQPVIERDLVRNPLPPMSPEDLVGVHGSKDDDRPSLQRHLAISNELIAELQQADALVIGVPLGIGPISTPSSPNSGEPSLASGVTSGCRKPGK